MVTAGAETKRRAYRGRFAPSPTGELHFGSLLAAVGSYLQARSRGGQWLVRIEDIDPPREVPGAARAQLETLAAWGLRPDAAPGYQSASAARHRAVLGQLVNAGAAFECGCSRRDLPASGRYPGTCRDGIAPGRAPRSIRFRVPETPIEIADAVFGRRRESLAEHCGDFVIRRADGLIAYQLAVVVDDLDSGITEVVRGADLLDSCARQQVLYAALGAPAPDWLHLPLAVDHRGRKLSKSDDADPVGRVRQSSVLRLILEALGQRPPPGRRTFESLWHWALANWSGARIPREPFELPRR